ncbi:MAG TPA: hypothetical protein VF877_11205 [Gaiellaceae bacterium]
MERIAVTARLRPGAECRARELIAAGPPFDPSTVGLSEHSVYVGNDLVVFVFEGVGLSRRLSDLVNDRIYAASFGSWAEVLAEQPRVAHEAYHWDPKEETDVEADPDRNRWFGVRAGSGRVRARTRS